MQKTSSGKRFFKNRFSDDTSLLLTTLVTDHVQALQSSPRNDWLKAQFLTKFVSDRTDPPLVRRTRAINKWLSCERDNYATNVRLLNSTPELILYSGVTFGRFIDRVRTIVRDIVGDTVPWDCLHGGFTGGASTSHRRDAAHPARKFLGKLDVTTSCHELAVEVINDSPLWSDMWTESGSHLNTVHGNILFTVPKNATIDRCAAKEPDLNMYLQRGIGNYFRSCLRSRGVNLNDQTKNKRLAWRGSLPVAHVAHLDLATVDLSSASDSVTCMLVDLVMPECITSLMNSVRSEYTLVDAEWHKNEMYSSMGNGFTFELESLLFYSIAKAVTYFGGYKGVVSVYGDDIIIPRDAFADLEHVLEWFGFAVNTDKSFHSGCFRESCGGHYNEGYDVTPFYLREPLSTVTSLISFMNQLRLWSARGNSLGPIDPCSSSYDEPGVIFCDLEELWMLLSEHIPRKLFGGTDFGSNTRLVSYKAGGFFLCSVTKERKLPDGAYLFWTHLVRDRIRSPDNPVITSSESLIGGLLRMRRASRAWLPTLLAYSTEWQVTEEMPR